MFVNRTDRKPWAVVAVSALCACLSACGGSTPSVAPSTTASGASVRESGSTALIYASGGCNGTCILTYPNGKNVSSIDHYANGICSDSSGDVFIPSESEIYEYNHGGSTPINTLAAPSNANEATSCGVDPSSGNLAVTFICNEGSGCATGVAIYEGAQGSGTAYYDGAQTVLLFAGYDNSGNLFVDGFNNQSTIFAELPAGGSTLQSVSLNQTITNPGQVQWDGTYITIESQGPRTPAIYQIGLSGSAGTVVGTTELSGVGNFAGQSWIQGGTVIVPYGPHKHQPKWLGLWNYPTGGHVVKKIKHLTAPSHPIEGVTVSVAPDLK